MVKNIYGVFQFVAEYSREWNLLVGIVTESE
jgi:hypothetical protein